MGKPKQIESACSTSSLWRGENVKYEKQYSNDDNEKHSEKNHCRWDDRKKFFVIDSEK